MKKISAFLLAGAVMVSAIPTAYAASSYTTEVTYESSNQESYTITVPAALQPNGSGEVKLEGQWPSNKTLKVTSDANVTLTNSIDSRETKTLSVTFEGISLAGNNAVQVSDTKNISVSDIQNAVFGTWSGTFYYNVELLNPAEPIDLNPDDGSTPADGDIYEYGDYRYTYSTWDWTYDQPEYGWRVSINEDVTDKNKTSYGPILESINGEPVISLYATFKNCTALTTAPTIPNSVIKMEETFENCTSLTTAPQIPDNVWKLFLTFEDCKSLTTAPVLPNSVTYMNQTFSGCTSLKTYVGSTDPDGDFSNYKIPDGVTNMDRTFVDTPLVIAPKLPDDVFYLDSTFFSCDSLTTAPAIPEGVYQMNQTFSGCTSLKTYVGSTDPDGDFSNYKIPDSVHQIKTTFYKCTSLTTAPAIPSNVTRMDSTFYGCTSLTTPPDMSKATSVTNMNETFENCTSLTTAPIIPDSVTDMGSTFSNCTSLTGTITINASPTIYTDCFWRTTQPITLTGTSTLLNELAATGNKGNVTVG